MNEKEIQRLTEYAVKKLETGVSKEEALRSLQQAGILNEKGDFTSHYQNLAKAVVIKG